MPGKTYYITTPIYYVNDKPHIGHCYTTMVADAAARFHRFAGRDVFFLTGTDEHAEKVVAAAGEQGLSPQAWADRNAAEFQAAFRELNLSNDDFIRTTEPRHKEKVAQYIQALLEKGDITLGDYVGWWDPSQEEYVTETTAREHDYASPVTGKPLVKRTEQNYFFHLSKYADHLLYHIKDNLGFLGPEARRNEVVGRIKQGLQDVPVSRAVGADDPGADWGVFMPGDESHRVYVWIDALFNYLTAIDTDERRKYWPPSVNLVGKDILWFHAVIWPCLLMALDKPLPKTVYAHSYWIREGRKMSKSLGNFLDLPTLRGYIKRYGLDAVRWYLLTQGPIGATDADFAHAKFVEVYNAHLANGIGNTFSRVSNMIGKYLDGCVPNKGGPVNPNTDRRSARLRLDVEIYVSQSREEWSNFDPDSGLRNGLSIIPHVDGYIHETEPFKLAKDPARKDDVAAILYHSAEALRIASLLLYPAMPGAMGELWKRMSLDINPSPSEGEPTLEALAQWGGLKPGTRIEKGEALFPRADPDEPAPEPVDSPLG